MPTDTTTLDTLRDLMQEHCFQYGDFTLASGRESKFYYNGKRVTLRPSGAKLIGEALADVVLASGAEAVGGPEIGAIPIAMAVGLASVERGHDLDRLRAGPARLRRATRAKGVRRPRPRRRAVRRRR